MELVDVAMADELKTGGAEEQAVEKGNDVGPPDALVSKAHAR